MAQEDAAHQAESAAAPATAAAAAARREDSPGPSAALVEALAVANNSSAGADSAVANGALVEALPSPRLTVQHFDGRQHALPVAVPPTAAKEEPAGDDPRGAGAAPEEAMPLLTGEEEGDDAGDLADFEAAVTGDPMVASEAAGETPENAEAGTMEHRSPAGVIGDQIVSPSLKALDSSALGEVHSPTPRGASSPFTSPVRMPSSALEEEKGSDESGAKGDKGSRGGGENGGGAMDGSDPGDADTGQRARDLISRELLDELSHEPDDWNDGRSPAPLPGHAGFETPSEPGTPSPRDHEACGTAPHHFLGTGHYGSGQQGGAHMGNNAMGMGMEGLMCIDQWDWKTDAPEFVPGSMKSPALEAAVPHRPTGGAAAPFHGNSTVSSGLSALASPWSMPSMPGGGSSQVGATPLAGSVAGGGLPSGAVPAPGNGAHDDDPRIAQIRQHYEWQLRQKTEEHRETQSRASQLELETARLRANWELERRVLVKQIAQYRAVLERYCIPIGEVGSAPPHAQYEEEAGDYYNNFPEANNHNQQDWGAGGNQQDWGAGHKKYDGSAGGGQAPPSAAHGASNKGAPEGGASNLDAKMRQLNNLLQETAPMAPRRPPSDSPHSDKDSRHRGAGKGGTPVVNPANAGSDGYSIASTLRTMFPHATIRTRADDAEAEEDTATQPEEQKELESIGQEVRNVEQLVRRLERKTGGQIDERALRAMQVLPASIAKEALAKVEELVCAQGGHCRNLSSILQSVCRKIEKRHDKPGKNNDAPRKGTMGIGDSIRTRRARRLDDEGDAFDSSNSDEDKGASSKEGADNDDRPTRRRDSSEVNINDSPLSKRSSKSWADIQSGDEGDDRELMLPDSAVPTAPSVEVEDENEHWTTARVERAARRGFELRRRGHSGNNWDLRISMGGLEPRLTEAGMDRYCQWLHQRLRQFTEEHGSEPLHRCRGEIDFSHNHLSNQMVWQLLETLAQHEVQAALVKLFANRISHAGVLAICEFIRTNERAEAVLELHLSHNEIDDDSALELLRTLQNQWPRYPPRRSADGHSEPVPAPMWLRLNHNRIRDASAVLRIAEAEGITVCTAWDRHRCGTSKCCRRDCPLVHLYSFSVQDAPRDGDANGEGRSVGRRKHRGRHYDT